MPNRWFIVPPVTFEETDDSGNVIDSWTGPKYSDTNGITGFSGNIHFFERKKYNKLPWKGNDMYVVRFYGTTTALDTVAGYDDAYGKQEHGYSDEEIASYLNDKFGRDWTFQEWVNSLFCNI